MAFKLIATLTEMAADRLGNHNPQLLREWQGRLRWRNLLITLAISIGVQGLLLLQRLAQLPTRTNNEFHPGVKYCLKQVETGCQVGPDKSPLLDWPLVWADVFRDLSFVLVWVLILAGVYLLTADLSKEARRGTLNFLRMSPLSGRRILLGKLLGVPVLMYLGIGAMLPLHLVVGLMATYPLKILLAFYGLLGAIAFCFYAAAMWFALLTPGLQGFQTWLISGLSLGLLQTGVAASHSNSSVDWFRLFSPLQLLSYWEVKGWGSNGAWLFGSSNSNLSGFRSLGWFLWPAGRGGDEYLLLALPNALLLGWWFWVLLERKFQIPGHPPLGKVQSYGLTVCLSLLVMGFNVQSTAVISDLWSYPISMVICAVILMFLLLPTRQAVLDWARYRHQRPQGQGSVVRDLLTHDGSPAVLAVGVNLAIMGGVFLLGFGITQELATGKNSQVFLVGWGFCAAVLLSCTMVMQWIALANLRHGRWITFGMAAALILGVPSILAMVGLNSYHSTFKGLWLMTVFSFTVQDVVSWGEMMGAIAAHLALISSLSFLLSRRLQRLGQSEWKALTASPSRSGLARRDAPA